MWERIIAGVATLLVVGSYIPQIVKAITTKSMRDVSIGFLLLIATGVALWICYGFLVEDIVFILANCVTFSFAVTLIAMKMHYG